ATLASRLGSANEARSRTWLPRIGNGSGSLTSGLHRRSNGAFGSATACGASGGLKLRTSGVSSGNARGCTGLPLDLGGAGAGNSVLFNGTSGFSSERGVARGGRPDGIAVTGALAPGVNNSINRCCAFASAGGDV